MHNSDMRCPCQSGEQFQHCCARYLTAETPAPTAEALMRSRFSAFALGDAHYLLRTWHPDERPDSLELDPDQQWYLLEILGTQRGGPFDSDGVVSFRAHYRSATNRKLRDSLDSDGVVSFRAHYRSATNRKLRDSLTETSSFTKVGKQWLYVKALEIEP